MLNNPKAHQKSNLVGKSWAESLNFRHCDRPLKRAKKQPKRSEIDKILKKLEDQKANFDMPLMFYSREARILNQPRKGQTNVTKRDNNGASNISCPDGNRKFGKYTAETCKVSLAKHASRLMIQNMVEDRKDNAARPDSLRSYSFGKGINFIKN